MQLTSDPKQDRRAKVMLYALGYLDELRDEGLVGGGIPLSEKGFSKFLELRATGFEPTKDELRSMFQFLMSDVAVEALNDDPAN